MEVLSALAKIALEKPIKADFENIGKIANFKNKAYVYKQEAISIISKDGAVNDTTHAPIDKH